MLFVYKKSAAEKEHALQIEEVLFPTCMPYRILEIGRDSETGERRFAVYGSTQVQPMTRSQLYLPGKEDSVHCTLQEVLFLERVVCYLEWDIDMHH
jgi:hypothetical protein